MGILGRNLSKVVYLFNLRIRFPCFPCSFGKFLKALQRETVVHLNCTSWCAICGPSRSSGNREEREISYFIVCGGEENTLAMCLVFAREHVLKTSSASTVVCRHVALIDQLEGAQVGSENVPACTSRNLVGLSPSVSSQLSRTAIPFTLGVAGQKVCLLCVGGSFQFGE